MYSEFSLVRQRENMETRHSGSRDNTPHPAQLETRIVELESGPWKRIRGELPQDLNLEIQYCCCLCLDKPLG